MHCRDIAVQLHRAREEFEAAGVDLVLIGQATPRQAAHFRRRLQIELPVLADEQRETYRAVGLKRGSITELLGPQSVLNGLKHGARSRVVQGRIVGDAAQLGGELIVAPGGREVFRHVQRNPGDTLDPKDLLAAAREAGGEPATAR